MNTTTYQPHLHTPSSHSIRQAMTYTDDKLFLGICTTIASSFAWIGSIIAPADIRWLCVTMAVSIMTSALLALAFRKPDETIQLVVARCGITILGGIFVTRLAVHYFGLNTTHTDAINLGGVTFAVSIGVFFLGYSGLRYLERRSDFLVGKFIDMKVRAAIHEEKEKSKNE